MDTGANVVAMNSSHAQALGVDYTAGCPRGSKPPVARSMPGLSPWSRSDVGGIRVDNVQATVVEGDFPATVLLGMTYLQARKNAGNKRGSVPVAGLVVGVYRGLARDRAA